MSRVLFMEKEGNQTLLQKFAAEPIVILQTIYNPVQVVLCTYMIAEAIREYREQDYSLICNAFNEVGGGEGLTVSSGSGKI